MEMLQLQRLIALLLLLHCVLVSAQTLLQKAIELPFCTGRSTLVTLGPSSALVLDGSNSAIARYLIESPFTQPGTMCTCHLSPLSRVGAIDMTLKPRTDPSVTKCTKNHRITVTPDFDYYTPCDAGDQSVVIEALGNRNIAVSLYILNAEIDDKYQLMIQSSSEEEINFQVRCFLNTEVSQSSTSSSTSSSPSTTHNSSAAGPSTTDGSSNENTATGLSTSQSNTVLVVCVIIGVGLLLMVLTICVLCCIAKRLGHWKKKTDTPRAPQRIYRRIRHTIRQLPQTFSLRRPLPPPPPANQTHQKLKDRSHVFVTDSGPYNSIKSSMRPNRMVPPKLDGATILSCDKGDYEYLYPVNKTDSKPKGVTRSEDPYITPIRDSRHLHDLEKQGTYTEQDSLYINTLKSNLIKSKGTDKGTENVDMTDNASNHSSDYMKMDFKTKEVRDCHVNSQQSEQNDAEISAINDKVLSSAIQTNNTSTTVQHSDENVYINITSDTDVMASHDDAKAITGDAKQTQGDIDNGSISTPRDSGYVSIGEMGVTKEAQPSRKDRTFPNMLQLHIASIKPKFHFSKKSKPKVLPKPQRYVRNMAGNIEK